MFAIPRLRGTMFARILGLAACFAGGSPAQAGGYDSYGYACAPVCHYETVTVYVPRTVAYTRLVTLYDACGRPYQVAARRRFLLETALDIMRPGAGASAPGMVSPSAYLHGRGFR
jgi:hypothetical protein